MCMLCGLEFIFAGLVCLGYLSHDSMRLEEAFFIVGLLTVATGIVSKPIAWIILIILWRKRNVPRQTIAVCTIVLVFATIVFLRILWTVLKFRT